MRGPNFTPEEDAVMIVLFEARVNGRPGAKPNLAFWSGWQQSPLFKTRSGESLHNHWDRHIHRDHRQFEAARLSAIRLIKTGKILETIRLTENALIRAAYKRLKEMSVPPAALFGRSCDLPGSTGAVSCGPDLISSAPVGVKGSPPGQQDDAASGSIQDAGPKQREGGGTL